MSPTVYLIGFRDFNKNENSSCFYCYMPQWVSAYILFVLLQLQIVIFILMDIIH